MCGKYGLIFSTALLPMITSDKGNGIDLDEAANAMANNNDTDNFGEMFLSGNSRKKFNKRLRGVIVDMIRLGYV